MRVAQPLPPRPKPPDGTDGLVADQGNPRNRRRAGREAVKFVTDDDYHPNLRTGSEVQVEFDPQDEFARIV